MKLSGSRMGLAWHCLYFARDDVVWPPRTSSLEADLGTAKHQIVEAIVNGLPPDMTLWQCDYRDAPSIQGHLANAVELLAPIGATRMPELSLAYDPEWDIASPIAGKYSHRAGPRQIPMRLDLVVIGEGYCRVVDWKTGRQTNTNSCAANAQIQAGCLAVSRAFGRESVEGVLVFFDDDGSYRLSRHTFDEFDFAEFASNYRDILDKTPSAEPVPGIWCHDHYCPVQSTCPATMSAIAETPVAGLSLAIQDDEHAARIYAQLGPAEEFLKAAQKALGEYVRTHNVLVDGKSLQWIRKTRESVKLNPKALAALQKALGPEACLRAVETKISASKTSIAAATAMLAKGPARTALERSIIEELQTCGAMSIASYETLGVL